MKLTNDTQSLTIKEDTVTIRDSGKTYKFQYEDVGVAAATSSKHYTYLHFYVPRYYAFEGSKQYFQYFSIGYNEVYNFVLFNAVYIKVLEKGNTAIHINGTFKCNVLEWLRNLPIQS